MKPQELKNQVLMLEIISTILQFLQMSAQPDLDLSPMQQRHRVGVGQVHCISPVKSNKIHVYV